MDSFLKHIGCYLFSRNSVKSLSKWLILLFDCFIVILSYFIFVLMRYIDNPNQLNMGNLCKNLIPIIIIFLINFLIFGSYNGLIRYSGFKDIIKLTNVGIGYLISIYIIKIIINHFVPSKSYWFLSYADFLFIGVISFTLLMFSRLTIRRIYNEYFKFYPKTVNTIIYGAGDAGPIIQNALYQDSSCNYKIIAFIDDSYKKIGKTLNGITIYSREQVLNNKFINNKKIEIMILAIPSLKAIEKQKIINKGLELGLNVKTIPHVNDWINGKFTVNQIKDINIEDLLERDPIVLDKENKSKDINGKIVMVTGAAGSIGSEICRQVLRYKPKKLILLDQAESPLYDIQFELKNDEPYKSLNIPIEFVIGNVKDITKMTEVFDKFHPQVIYHAAAYKHVPLMENYPYEAVLVNVLGTKNIADLAIKYNVKKFVMISTDKAINPTNVMGASKRIAEIYTQSRHVENTSFITTRFGNVLGSNGSVIPLFKKQLAKGGPLTVTDKNITRYFMTISEACSLVLEAGAIGKDGDIFVFDMGSPVKIYDLANKMIKLSKLPDIKIEIIGLRQGEKLYEELLAAKEKTIPTEHPKIMRAKVREYTKSEVDEKIVELINIIPTCDDFKIVANMKEIVPEFISNNSVYSSLDCKD